MNGHFIKLTSNFVPKRRKKEKKKRVYHIPLVLQEEVEKQIHEFFRLELIEPNVLTLYYVSLKNKEVLDFA